jgi:hypothetical protein
MPTALNKLTTATLLAVAATLAAIALLTASVALLTYLDTAVPNATFFRLCPSDSQNDCVAFTWAHLTALFCSSLFSAGFLTAWGVRRWKRDLKADNCRTANE